MQQTQNKVAQEEVKLDFNDAPDIPSAGNRKVARPEKDLRKSSKMLMVLFILFIMALLFTYLAGMFKGDI